MMRLSTMRKVVDTLNENWKSPIGDNILKSWEHTPKTAIYFRASANFVFRFSCNGKTHFLRFNSVTERSQKDIESEIELLKRLNQMNSDIVKPILSINNRYIEKLKTEDDTYLAVVFEGFEGKMYETDELTKEQFFFWGKALGKLHRLMDDIPEEITNKRQSWRDHLDFIKENIPSDNSTAFMELDTLQKWASNTNTREGLIHFDFELDNLHWYDNDIKIFDFDDSAVYWYGADIAYALRDLFEDGIDTANPSFRRFMEGYSTEFEIDPNLYDNLPMFMRFHNLYSYARIKRCLYHETDENMPDWLIGLNKKLSGIADRLNNSFSVHR